MSKETYLVTGAAGHLGSYIVKELLQQGKRVHAFLLPGEKCPQYITKNKHLLSEHFGNICDFYSIVNVLNDCKSKDLTIIHSAGIISILNKKDRHLYDVNVKGTENIIKICEMYSVKRLVYISSVHAIPSLPQGQIINEVQSFDPDAVFGYYDKTKAIATQLVLNAVSNGLNAVIVHPSGIIGPHGLPTGNMSQLISLYVMGKLPAAIEGGYDFVDVRDVAAGVIAAAAKGKCGECYILSNRFVGMKEFFDILFHAGAKRKQKIYLPFFVVKAIAPLAEIYYYLSHKIPLFTRYSLSVLQGNGMYSHEKASRELKYTTRPIKETLIDTVKWIKGLNLEQNENNIYSR